MSTPIDVLNNFYIENKNILLPDDERGRGKVSINPGKKIYRPISRHIHELFDQFEKKNVFDLKKPNKKVLWATEGSSTWSQKRRTISGFGIINENEKKNPQVISLNNEGKRLRDLYFERKEFDKNKIPDFFKDSFLNYIQKTNLDNINLMTNTILCALRLAATEGYYFSLNIGSANEFKSFSGYKLIKSFYLQYFNHTQESGDLLDWVRGILQPLGIIEKSDLEASKILDIDETSAKKIKVFSLTKKGIDLINSLDILKGKITKSISKVDEKKKIIVTEYLSAEEHQKRQQHLPSQADIKITRLNTNVNFQKEHYNKTVNYKKSNPSDSKRATEKAAQIHNYTLSNAGKFIEENGCIPEEVKKQVDLLFVKDGHYHVFEIKSFKRNPRSRIRDGIAQLLEYSFINKKKIFNNKKYVLHLLFSKEINEGLDKYPYIIGFLDSLNINLCFMQDKKIVWHKDFKNNDPFLKN